MIKQESRTYFAALGKHIALIRRSHGLTQAELARAIGVSQQAQFAYELGQRRVSVLLLTKIARVLSISVQELVSLARPLRVVRGKVSPRAIRHGERLQALRKTDERFVIRIIDVLEERATNR